MAEKNLLVMAAGMGSRYGGLKQMDPMGQDGSVILDYSVYDAVRAGFKRVVFIIKEEHRELFEERIAKRMRPYIDVDYAYQHLDDLPEGFSVPDGRSKPWGTAHAVLCARPQITGPFAALNADDYYGPSAFKLMSDWLDQPVSFLDTHYAMIGYQLRNTVSAHGSVARGVCKLGSQGELLRVDERTKIVQTPNGILDQSDEANVRELDPNTLVSMNFWGFPIRFLDEIESRLPAFLTDALEHNPIKAELYLPTVVTDLMESKRVSVQVLPSQDAWFGVTYQEDKPEVLRRIHDLHNRGLYPEQLWAKAPH